MLLNLPCETIHHIASFLTPKERLNLRKVHPVLRNDLPHYPEIVPLKEASLWKQDLIRILGETFLFNTPLLFEYPFIQYTNISYKKYFSVFQQENKLRIKFYCRPIPFLSTLKQFFREHCLSMQIINHEPNLVQIYSAPYEEEEILVEPKCMKSFCVLLYIEMVCYIHKKDKHRVIKNMIQKLTYDEPFVLESEMVKLKPLPILFHQNLLDEWFKNISYYFLDKKDAIYYLSFIK